VVFTDIFSGECGSKSTTNNNSTSRTGKTNMKTKTTHSLALALITIAAAALPAAAQSDTIIYTPLGININVPETGAPGSEFVPAFAPVPNLPDQAVLLLDPPGPGNQNISDAIWSQSGFLYFESDVNGLLTHWPVAGISVVAAIPETGLLQDVGVLFQSASGAPAFAPNTLLIASTEATPEPSTFALLGIGGAVGAASFLRRRKV
jgi:hypothetical protein